MIIEPIFDNYRNLIDKLKEVDIICRVDIIFRIRLSEIVYSYLLNYILYD